VDGDTIVVTPDSGTVEDWRITLEYRGRPTRSPRGTSRGVNAPYVFSYSRFDPRATWDVKVYAWNDTTHPLNARAAFDSLLRGERGSPAAAQTTNRLDDMWYRPPASMQGWPPEKYGIAANAEVELPDGAYTLRTISDDGVRVWIDGRLAIDNWAPHESKIDSTPLGAGRHDLRVEYYQLQGWTELRLDILRGLQRSEGSPGPH